MSDTGTGNRTRFVVNTFGPDVSLLIAREQGLFAREGLDVEQVITPSSTVQMRGLGDGTFQMAFTNFDNVLSWSGRDGGPELAAVAQLQGSVELSLWARPETPTIASLRGKPLAADAPDTAFALVLRRILQLHGLEMGRDYALLAVGATSARLESMRKGETFAAMLNPPQDRQAAEVGFVKLVDAVDAIPTYPGGSVVAVNRAWAEANRQQVVGFLRAWLAGGRWAAENRDAATDIAARVQGVPRDAVRVRFPPAGGQSGYNRVGLQSQLDLRVGLGLTPSQGPDVDTYLAPELLAQALSAGAAEPI